MQNLEPPEVPLGLISKSVVQGEKKEGFFKKLFSKKSHSDSIDSSVDSSKKDKDILFGDLPSLDTLDFPKNMNLSMSDLELPGDINNSSLSDTNSIDLLNQQLIKSDSLNNVNTKSNASTKLTKLPKGKSKGKVHKGISRNIAHLDESSQFDWTREVKDQEILIHDSNRFNQDVNILIKETDSYVNNTTANNNDKTLFASNHKDVNLTSDNLNIPELTPLVNPINASMQENALLPILDKKEHADFSKMYSSHNKLRLTLNRYLKNAKLFKNKQKVAELFKQYDTNIEQIIEDKELALARQKKDLNQFESHLKKQEKDIQSVHSFITTLDSKLKAREKELNNLISETVEKELARRLVVEKKQLGAELKKVALLNNDLKKKLKLLDDDSIKFKKEYDYKMKLLEDNNLAFKKEHEYLVEIERQKLTQMQSIYERKLSELNSEKSDFELTKKSFEDRRLKALELFSRADAISKELSDIDKIKIELENNKNIITKELIEDKELKLAIDKAELELTSEKENLDNMIFSKYLENKLKNIKPGYLNKEDDWKNELKSHPLYRDIFDCRKVLLENDIVKAKSLYNLIRKSYDTIDSRKDEKEALYTAIRELYNDIQLKIVESQLNS